MKQTFCYSCNIWNKTANWIYLSLKRAKAVITFLSFNIFVSD
jgi:hypothetical protein